MPGLLIFIDFEKAFDSLEWNFLYNCLDVFNFGPNFKRWIKSFQDTNFKSWVVNNGLCSDYFELTRGVRRAGRPSLPVSFSLAVETLAITIRANEEMKGIVINQEETAKLLQYADDTTAALYSMIYSQLINSSNCMIISTSFLV